MIKQAVTELKLIKFIACIQFENTIVRHNISVMSFGDWENQSLSKKFK